MMCKMILGLGLLSLALNPAAFAKGEDLKKMDQLVESLAVNLAAPYNASFKDTWTDLKTHWKPQGDAEALSIGYFASMRNQFVFLENNLVPGGSCPMVKGKCTKDNPTMLSVQKQVKDGIAVLTRMFPRQAKVYGKSNLPEERLKKAVRSEDWSEVESLLLRLNVNNANQTARNIRQEQTGDTSEGSDSAVDHEAPVGSKGAPGPTLKRVLTEISTKRSVE